MKTLITTRNVLIAAILFTVTLAGFTQNIDFVVQGRYQHPVLEEKIRQARNLSDIIPYYPSGWISQYESVVLSTVTDDKTLAAVGSDDKLTPEQLALLQSAGLGTEIAIEIQYRYFNDITRQFEDRQLSYSSTIVPETEAEFPGGDERLTQYVKGNAIDRLSEVNMASLQQTVVRFTVDEQGGVANAEVSQSSGDPEVDKMFLEAIDDMPEWQPARDAEGINVPQDFQLTVWKNDGC